MQKLNKYLVIQNVEYRWEVEAIDEEDALIQVINTPPKISIQVPPMVFTIEEY
jgi:hypothetical protein